MPKEVETVVFILASILLGLLFLLFFIYPLVKRLLYENKTIRFYYNKVRRVVDEYDLLLINQWNVHYGSGKDESVHIDHLVVGDRYIYLIKDRYFRGAVKGSIDDETWLYYFGQYAHKKIHNPIKLNQIRLNRFAGYSRLDPSYFLTIVLVNDDAYFELDKTNAYNHYLLPLSKLESFIKTHEEDKSVSLFNKDEMIRLVQDLAKIKNHG